MPCSPCDKISSKWILSMSIKAINTKQHQWNLPTSQPTQNATTCTIGKESCHEIQRSALFLEICQLRQDTKFWKLWPCLSHAAMGSSCCVKGSYIVQGRTSSSVENHKLIIVKNGNFCTHYSFFLTTGKNYNLYI